MYDWNGNGQIDPMDQFIDYMVFQEVMGRGSNDEDDSEDDEDDQKDGCTRFVRVHPSFCLESKFNPGSFNDDR